MKTKKRGFTIMEVMIGIIIVGVLAGVSVPVYQNLIIKAHMAQVDMDFGTVLQLFKAYYDSHFDYPPNAPCVSELNSVDFANATGMPGLPEDRPDMIYKYCSNTAKTGMIRFCYLVEAKPSGGSMQFLVRFRGYPDGRVEAQVSTTHPWGNQVYNMLQAAHPGWSYSRGEDT